MSSIKLTADSGGGSVSLKAPATTTGNAALEFTVPDVATGSTVVTADSSGHISLADSKELRVGTGDDLKIFHDGSHSRINATDGGTGRLIISGKDGSAGDPGLQLNAEDSKESIMCDVDAGVRIFHNGTLKISTQSGGLCFNADTADANALDDYEEGTFTPAVRGVTGVGTVAYNGQSGYYIKIGKQVTCWVDLTVTSWSGASGGQQISGFPYAKSFETGYYYSGTTNWYVDTNMGGTAVYTGYFADGSSTLNMFNGSTWANIASCGINVTGRTSFMIIYTTS